MNEKKDFRLYAQKRAGYPPRSIIQNTLGCIIEDLQHQKRINPITIIEFGFSHGNDSRYIIDSLVNKFGKQSWDYWGFDHEAFFSPQFVLDKYSDEVRVNLHLLPCLFENIALGVQAFPENSDLIYSSKSLSLCDKSLFPHLMDAICSHITIGGYFVGTFHLNTSSKNHFWTAEEYFEMFFAGVSGHPPLFNGFSSQFAINEERQTFACFSKKSGTTSVFESTVIIRDRNNSAYVEASHGE